MPRTPLVVVPGRFSTSASALRYRAVVTARALSEAVLLAGGEPLTVHPWAPDGTVDADDVGRRLGFADAVLLPGGGDLHPRRYGQNVASDSVYDVDEEQDAFDLAVAEWALSAGVPLLAVCRGLQVVNVLRGGDLRQHMPAAHRNRVHQVSTTPGSLLASLMGPAPTVSCYHHQCLDRLGTGLRPVAWATQGTVEAVEIPQASGWFLGVQWHPEDTATTDPAQLGLVRALVDAARC